MVSGLRDVMTTPSAPLFASTRAVSRPIPRLAPVTTATFPATLTSMVISLWSPAILRSATEQQLCELQGSEDHDHDHDEQPCFPENGAPGPSLLDHGRIDRPGPVPNQDRLTLWIS